MKSYNLLDCLHPMNFDDVVNSTKRLAGFTSINGDGEKIPGFQKPSLALKIGYAIDNSLMLMQGMGLRKGDDILADHAKKFHKLYLSERSVRISSASLHSLADNKFNKEDLLPLTSDLLLLKQYCENRTKILVKTVAEMPTLETWRELAEVILTRITIYNKRRGNEPSSLLLKRYQEKSSHSKVVHSDITDSLSSLEKALLKR